MKRVPTAILVLFIVLMSVFVSRSYISESLKKIELAVFNVEMNQGSSAAIRDLKNVYETHQPYMLLLGDRDAILQIGMAIDAINPGVSDEEVLIHLEQVKSQLKRAEILLLSVF